MFTRPVTIEMYNSQLRDYFEIAYKLRTSLNLEQLRNFYGKKFRGNFVFLFENVEKKYVNRHILVVAL